MGKCLDLELNNGHKMPIVGLGTWQANNYEEVENALDAALEAGYRHFDTAYLYSNEEAIGKVLQKWFDSGKITRDDLFIVTKLPQIGMRPQHVPHFLGRSLASLGLDYVDLYLIHSPVGFNYINDTEFFPMKDGKTDIDKSTNLEAIWKAMEEQVEKGLAKSIGLSNFSANQIERILKMAKIKPANLQIEVHAYFQQKELVEVCKKHGITVCAYGPIGSPGRTEFYKSHGVDFERIPLMEDPVVVDIALAHGKTPAQILLRFLTQQDIIVIPKSTNKNRLKQNIELDFDLSDSELKSLCALDKGEGGRTFDLAALPGVSEHPEYNA